MEAKHTKSEWAWQKFGDKYCLTAQHGMREIILSSNIDEEKSLQPYLSMNDDGILKPIDPNHPNAKLIAAAPDLLKALQSIVDRLPIALKEGFLSEEYTDAVSAIKKATK